MIRKISVFLLFYWQTILCFSQNNVFLWPEGKTFGLSLTWDDGRESQPTIGLPLLDKYGVKATFYVLPSAVEKQLGGWKKVVKSGHEIANHSLNHPCSGNFIWSRNNALENYTVAKMEAELMEANDRIKALLGVSMTEFAYPCGQTFIGREQKTESYVPIIAKNFSSGRTWLDEAPNDPSYCDLSQITGMEMDGKSFDEILKWIEAARKSKSWLVLAGHEINITGPQTTKTDMLEKLFKYLKINGKDIWVAPVGEISKYVLKERGI